MSRELPKGEAEKTPQWAKNGLKKSRKPVRRLIQTVAAEKKADARHHRPASTSDPFAHTANPYLIEAAQDVVTKTSTRFRTLFPTKWNALLAPMQPIDVILLAMQIELHDGNYREAAKFARDAAPYRHPRLSQVHATIEKTAVDTMTEAALMELVADIGEKLKSRGIIDGTAIAGETGRGSDAAQAPAGTTALLTVS